MIRALLLLLIYAIAPPALADRDRCDDAARYAAQVFDVPAEILRAITLTETMHDGSAWPWTINHLGRGHWMPSQAEAAARAAEIISNGGSADIGCFQLNSRWHAKAFPSAYAMLDPIENALYAARYLAKLRDDVGNWDDAIAAYHSRNAEIGARYLARVQNVRSSLPEGGTRPTDVTEYHARRQNRFPLLLAGDPASAGTIMPRQARRSPLMGGP